MKQKYVIGFVWKKWRKLKKKTFIGVTKKLAKRLTSFLSSLRRTSADAGSPTIKNYAPCTLSGAPRRNGPSQIKVQEKAHPGRTAFLITVPPVHC